ncbi:serine/threonine-protein phosphatase [Aeromicrobium phragmitis]|uniref:Serine/threonine-protein phosphatase n=1 Tax=Aeromicrobium phragmitis TaxID=2478914 RepID=A0A3L8PIU0_9ACTN|nr:PP2C family protein-serine/threonine phosphatase [Aeromicrobium phragmitis]RLV55161.1 serine/threonine-protein phosphatase [Aeromicrobium phragmitis]
MLSSTSPRRSTVRYADELVDRWRQGSSEGQTVVLSVLIATTVLMFFGSVTWYGVFPAVSFLLPLVVGGLMLRWKPLAGLTAVALIAALGAVGIEATRSGLPAGRLGTITVIVIVALLQLYMARLNRSELPGPLGQAMFVDLRDRLQAQGRIPQLPEGWRTDSQVRSAEGTSYAGDFMVARLSQDEKRLELVLVDVCGKGVAAGTQALQFSGALGGLIGSLPPLGFFLAANDYLLRQHWVEGFATAVHVVIDFDTGRYTILSAGHPPVLRWCSRNDDWYIDGASGTALGVMDRPHFQSSEGVLERGEALLLYTDGVVESRDHDLADGIHALQENAAEAIRLGFAGAPARILERVPDRGDDRAVVLIEREV